LEQEPALRGRLRFAGNQVEIVVNDRLIAPNSDEVFEAIRPEIDFLARRLYASANFTLSRNGEDARQRLKVTILTPLLVEMNMLLNNLQSI
jgi:hypothetical protein